MNERLNQAQFDKLDRELRALRVDVEKYFNGALDLPPEDAIEALATAIRGLQGRTKGVAEQFRLSSIEAQFNSLREQFGRRMRQRELHGPRRSSQPPPARPLTESFDPRIGIVVADAVPDAAAEALHRELYQQGKERVDVLTFKGFLERQATQLRDRTGCAGVRFRLAEEDGQLRLKAKPVHRGV